LRTARDFQVVKPATHVADNDDGVPTGRNRLRRSDRSAARLERDFARGYSINVKQVLLAFAVEFVIIGLILTNQSAVAAEISNSAWLSFIKGASLPIALAMAELARVPLAIAVRTQPSWNIKFVAAVGVLAAVVVTSVNLSLIGWNTYDPRLAEVNDTNNTRQDLRAEKESVASQLASLGHDTEQRISKRDGINDRLKNLQSQITAISTTKCETCNTVTAPDGSSTRRCTLTNIANAPILRTLQTQLAAAQKELDDADIAVRQADKDRSANEFRVREIEGKIAKADSDYRVAINRSQLHSYAAMLFGKNPSDLSEGEIKTLERYLIWIPAIAAALSSTLIAMTAVRRIRQDRDDVTIPDDAMTNLFGPLIETINAEARNAVAAAMNERARPTAAPNLGKT
jgi:hypothetical protein